MVCLKLVLGNIHPNAELYEMHMPSWQPHSQLHCREVVFSSQMDSSHNPIDH